MFDKLFNNKFLVGMASIFNHNIIRVHKINASKSDSENIYNDWVNVGNYIQSAYDNMVKQ